LLSKRVLKQDKKLNGEEKATKSLAEKLVSF